VKCGNLSFRLEKATVAFAGTTALDAVSLEVAPGEAVGFVGPSGAGKTTLLRLLNGSAHPTSGRVFVSGKDLASLPPREMRRLRADIGFVHQDLSLVPNLRVSQNVIAGRLGRLSFLRSLGTMLRPREPLLEEVHALLDRVGIPEKIFERADRLSGGQRQRVAIARALFQRPCALLADEPVSSVDPARARDTVSLLLRLSREEELTLCVSLHNLEIAREYLPRLVGLRHGRVAFDRPASAVSEADFKALYDLSPREILEDRG
jgi:phosphonate transport system ATP-binding protein